MGRKNIRVKVTAGVSNRARHSVIVGCCLFLAAPAFSQITPGEIISAVNTAKGIYGFLYPGPNTSQQILNELTHIRGELDQISGQLHEISTQLQLLSVQMNADFNQTAEIEVVSDLQYIADNWRAWSNKLDHNSQQQFDIVLQKLQLDTANLRNWRSFGSYQVVGYSMYVQRVMMELEKTPASTQAAIFGDFSSYFAQAVDPQVMGSLAYAQAQEQSSANQLKDQFGNGQTFICNVGTSYTKCCGPTKACIYQDYQAVSGSVTQPFSLVGPVQTQQTGTGTNIFACPAAHPVGRFHPASWDFSPQPRLLRVSSQGPIVECPAQLNATRQKYLDANDSASALEQAVAQAVALEQSAATLQQSFAHHGK